MKNTNGEVWVFAEQEEGKLSDVPFELLGKARELATKLGVKVGAVLMGEAMKYQPPSAVVSPWALMTFCTVASTAVLVMSCPPSSMVREPVEATVMVLAVAVQLAGMVQAALIATSSVAVGSVPYNQFVDTFQMPSVVKVFSGVLKLMLSISAMMQAAM